MPKGYIGAITLIQIFLILFLGPCHAQATDAPLHLTLKEAIKLTLDQNPDLRSLRTAIFAQHERRESVARDKWAKLQAGYGYTWFNQSPYIKFKDFPLAHEIPFGKSREVHWYLQLTQPLFTGFALSTKEAMESLGIDVKRVEYELGRLELKFQVKKAYFEVLMAHGRMKVAEDEVAALRAHLKKAKFFFEEGLIARNDLLRSQVAYKASLQRLEEAKAQYNTWVSYLDSLLHLPVDTPLNLKDVEVPRLDVARGELRGLAMQKRPELKALDLSIRQARLKRRLAKSGLYPQLNLVGRYERVGDDLLAERNDFMNSENTLLILEAQWTLFEWGKTLHQMKEARYKINELEEKAQALRTKISFELEKAWNNLLAAKKNIDTAQTAVRQAQEDFRLTTLQYEEQLASTSDVLDARRYLTEAETNLLQARYGYLSALALLERAVGMELASYGD